MLADVAVGSFASLRQAARLRRMSAMPSMATKSVRRNEPTPCAMTGLMRCSKTASSFDQVVHGTGTGHSRNGTLWNFGGLDVRLAHSGLMLAERITLPHFSVSSPINLRKSVGEPASGGPPKSASRALILASANEALISSLSRS